MQLDAVLSSREFILGSPEPTHLDIVLASMTCHLLFHENSMGYAMPREAKATAEEAGEDVKRERELFLARPCGKLAQKMYDQYRFKTIK